MTSMTDPNGRTTDLYLRWPRQPVERDRSSGRHGDWSYDSHGNVLSHTDKRGQHDKHLPTIQSGDLIQTTDPLGDVWSYTYDAVGNRISMTDPNGNTTQYQYDGLNRLTKTTDALGRHGDEGL